jgi:hypothetical protein
MYAATAIILAILGVTKTTVEKNGGLRSFYAAWLLFLQNPHGVTSQRTTLFIVTDREILKSYIALTGWTL